MKIRQRHCLIVLASLLLSGCGTWWEKDNTPPPTPLSQITPKVRPHRVWDARISFDINYQDSQFNPAVTDNNIVIVDQNGTITAMNKTNGRIQWKTRVNAAVSSGVAINDQLIVVGSKSGEVIALNAQDRRLLWIAHMNSEILATPAIGSNLVIAKSVDGKIAAFSNVDGHLVWRHQEVEPNLILRGASNPQLTSGAVVVGYANGKVEKLSLKDGHELWSQAVAQPDGAFAIQRMIDVDADPLISNNQVFAATYQGKIASLNLSSGRSTWDSDVSAFAGIAVDASHVYVSDAKSDVWAFDRSNGRIVWKQTQLEHREITGPVLVGPYLVVGDAEGVLHWLNRDDGNFAGRVQVSSRGILTKPAAENNTIYAITKDGYLSAYAYN